MTKSFNSSSRESCWPHWPFWRIGSGAETVRCRSDGTSFSRLTSEGRGLQESGQ